MADIHTAREETAAVLLEQIKKSAEAETSVSNLEKLANAYGMVIGAAPSGKARAGKIL